MNDIQNENLIDEQIQENVSDSQLREQELEP